MLFANNDKAGGSIAMLLAAGIEVVAYVDPRTAISEDIQRQLESCGAKLFAGGMVRQALGRLGLRGVEITAVNGGIERLECDLLAMSGGWNPNVQLTSHQGGKPVWDENIAAFVPGGLPPGMNGGRRSCR